MARKRNYLNNRDLLEEIILSKEKDELTPKALEFLMLLADKCSNRLTYRNPEDKGIINLSFLRSTEEVILLYTEVAGSESFATGVIITKMLFIGYQNLSLYHTLIFWIISFISITLIFSLR